MSLYKARRKCEAWRSDCNEMRPHSAIDNVLAFQFALSNEEF
jgi:hypothetical protein